MQQGEKTSESRETWRIKEQMETATMLDAGEAGRAWLPAETQLPGCSARRIACDFTAPPWKSGIKERQTAGKDGLNGLVDAGLCAQTREKEGT